MRRLLLASSLPLSLTACAVAGVDPVVSAPAEIDAASVTGAVSATTAWRRLTTELPGSWQAPLGTHAITVTYRITARESVLLETWMPGTAAETLSAYHLDGDRLVVTHYCGQHNQPRLHLADAADGLRFARFDATDLDPNEAALGELTLTLDQDTLVRDEVYTLGEARERTTLTFTRMDASPAPGLSSPSQP